MNSPELKAERVLPTEDELFEYLFLRDAIQSMQSRVEEIKRACKDAGSFCTENFVCAVFPQTQTRLVGLEAVIEALGKDLLEQHGLINHLEFQIVKIAYRNKV